MGCARRGSHPGSASALLARFGTDEQSASIQTITADEVIAFGQTSMTVDSGTRAVFGTALTCGTPGSGIHVTTDHLTGVTAAMYAGALLTAGIGDGEVVVAAPPDAEAQGIITLAGIFKTLQAGACGKSSIAPSRQAMAYRWFTTTQALGQALNDPHAALYLHSDRPAPVARRRQRRSRGRRAGLRRCDRSDRHCDPSGSASGHPRSSTPHRRSTS